MEKVLVNKKTCFAFRIVYWMFNRPMEQTENFLKINFCKTTRSCSQHKNYEPYMAQDTIELLSSSYTVLSAN